jgi:hypothetical protein
MPFKFPFTRTELVWHQPFSPPKLDGVRVRHANWHERVAHGGFLPLRPKDADRHARLGGASTATVAITHASTSPQPPSDPLAAKARQLTGTSVLPPSTPNGAPSASTAALVQRLDAIAPTGQARPDPQTQILQPAREAASTSYKVTAQVVQQGDTTAVANAVHAALKRLDDVAANTKGKAKAGSNNTDPLTAARAALQQVLGDITLALARQGIRDDGLPADATVLGTLHTMSTADHLVAIEGASADGLATLAQFAGETAAAVRRLTGALGDSAPVVGAWTHCSVSTMLEQVRAACHDLSEHCGDEQTKAAYADLADAIAGLQVKLDQPLQPVNDARGAGATARLDPAFALNRGAGRILDFALYKGQREAMSTALAALPSMNGDNARIVKQAAALRDQGQSPQDLCQFVRVASHFMRCDAPSYALDQRALLRTALPAHSTLTEAAALRGVWGTAALRADALFSALPRMVRAAAAEAQTAHWGQGLPPYVAGHVMELMRANAQGSRLPDDPQTFAGSYAKEANILYGAPGHLKPDGVGLFGEEMIAMAARLHEMAPKQQRDVVGFFAHAIEKELYFNLRLNSSQSRRDLACELARQLPAMGSPQTKAAALRLIGHVTAATLETRVHLSGPAYEQCMADCERIVDTTLEAMAGPPCDAVHQQMQETALKRLTDLMFSFEPVTAARLACRALRLFDDGGNGRTQAAARAFALKVMERNVSVNHIGVALPFNTLARQLLERAGPHTAWHSGPQRELIDRVMRVLARRAVPAQESEVNRDRCIEAAFGSDPAMRGNAIRWLRRALVSEGQATERGHMTCLLHHLLQAGGHDLDAVERDSANEELLRRALADAHKLPPDLTGWLMQASLDVDANLPKQTRERLRNAAVSALPRKPAAQGHENYTKEQPAQTAAIKALQSVFKHAGPDGVACVDHVLTKVWPRLNAWSRSAALGDLFDAFDDAGREERALMLRFLRGLQSVAAANPEANAGLAEANAALTQLVVRTIENPARWNALDDGERIAIEKMVIDALVSLDAHSLSTLVLNAMRELIAHAGGSSDARLPVALWQAFAAQAGRMDEASLRTLATAWANSRSSLGEADWKAIGDTLAGAPLAPAKRATVLVLQDLVAPSSTSAKALDTPAGREALVAALPQLDPALKGKALTQLRDAQLDATQRERVAEDLCAHYARFDLGTRAAAMEFVMHAGGKQATQLLARVCDTLCAADWALGADGKRVIARVTLAAVEIRSAAGEWQRSDELALARDDSGTALSLDALIRRQADQDPTSVRPLLQSLAARYNVLDDGAAGRTLISSRAGVMKLLDDLGSRLTVSDLALVIETLAICDLPAAEAAMARLADQRRARMPSTTS